MSKDIYWLLLILIALGFGVTGYVTKSAFDLANGIFWGIIALNLKPGDRTK